MKKRKKLKISTKILIAVFSVCIILNAVAWLSKGFCDWYAEKVFPLWENSLGRLTSLTNVSVGEIMILTAVIGIPLSLILLVVLLVKKKGKRKKVLKTYGLTYLWIIAFIAVTETLNCFILYHCSTFAKLYDIPQQEHTTAQLEQLCEELIVRANELAVQVERDENGQFVLTADLDETAKEAMRNLGEEFPRLKGYYVDPKPVKNSYFMSRQYLMGIYFPFSMEANYNRLMYPSNLPDTVCHELAHTKGFILEDEANFIAFLACTRSDNIEYQYSGYMNALKYVINKVEEYSGDEVKEKLGKMVSSEVATDYVGNIDYWQKVQEDDSGLVSSETVAKISDKAMETSLKLNGVEDGKKSYGRMVDLLLNYYYDIT
ncbi:MAG: DUF3810 domain-containing protein [Oscillospiraceae bacterium]